MMHFDIPVLAHGCAFNRQSTEGKAHYFETSSELAELMINLDPDTADQNGVDMLEIAQRRYSWEHVGRAYFELLECEKGEAV